MYIPLAALHCVSCLISQGTYTVYAVVKDQKTTRWLVSRSCIYTARTEVLCTAITGYGRDVNKCRKNFPIHMHVLQRKIWSLYGMVCIQDTQPPMPSFPMYSVVDKSKKKQKGSHTTSTAVMQQTIHCII